MSHVLRTNMSEMCTAVLLGRLQAFAAHDEMAACCPC